MKKQYVVLLVGILLIVFLLLFKHKELEAQTVSPSVTPTGQPMQSVGSTNPSPASTSFSLPAPVSPSQNALSTQQTGDGGPGVDPTTGQHTNATGGRRDIVQIGAITVSQKEAYTGDDITFTVTIQNVASYKKFVRMLCFNSNEGNFGCSPGFNLGPGQVFTISNSGRFTSSGIKSVGISWSQDNVNYLAPVNASAVSVTIL